MASANPQKSVLHKPTSGRFIGASLLAALLVNLLPWNGAAVLLWPDLVAMVLLYWAIHQPRRVGMTTAWVFGLCMDIADGVLFGQHALAYVLMVYAAYVLHRRIQTFSLWQQALYVFGLLLLMDLVMLAVRLSFGAAFPGVLYFSGSVVGAVLWPMLSLLLQTPQRKKASPESAYSSASR
jgi:rod shape-determining protein MreD